MKQIWINLWAWKYRYILRPIFFKFDSEFIHHALTSVGGYAGRFHVLRRWTSAMLVRHDQRLCQTYYGVTFTGPVGLAAGFDYKGELPQILPSLGFGFGTIGTISNNPYGGNPPPLLGRLVRSRSLMVNKGFKNDGIRAIAKKFSGASFEIPIGISIGKTNGQKPMTQKEAIDDIVEAFKVAEVGKLPFSYYELNISCPNLFGSVTFYPPENLRELLSNVAALSLSKPLFVKMPIEKSDNETRQMLDVITEFPVAAVIFGNLQKDRSNPALIPEEAAKYPKGNFSGKPTWARSNELIALAYREYGKRLTVIGCGGIFSAEDAYTKIRLGASLVQLVTGLVFVGPQLPAAINEGLCKFLERDRFLNLKDAVGADSRR